MNIFTPNSPHTCARDNRVAHVTSSNTCENPVADISVVTPSAVEARCPAHPGLQDMPVELLHNIFSRLSYIEKVVVKSTFLAADWVVNDILSKESKCWFSRFSPQQQAKLKKIAEETDVQVIRTWLGQFTKEDKVVKHLIDNRYHRHYHEFLFYAVSQLMADCQAFKIEQVASFEHTDTVVSSTFSDDGNHMLTQTYSSQSKICSLSPGGNWMENTTICDGNMLILTWTHFSGDGKHVIIRYAGSSPSKICAQNSDGNWVVKNTLPQDGHIKFIEFSPDGLHMAIIDQTSTLRIYGQGKNGAWAEVKKGTFSDRVYDQSPKFNRNSNELVAVSNDGELLIYRRGSDWRWTENDILPNKTSTYVRQVSPNDSHMITLHIPAHKAKIFGRGTDGDWMEQTVIDHPAYSADFSPDSRYLVINSFSTAAVYYFDINGRWIKKATQALVDNNLFITTAFSFDGRFLVIPVKDDTVKLFNLGADGQCTEMTSIDRATHAFFSIDGNHIFTYYYRQGTFDNNSSLLRIYGLSQDGKLKLKGIIDHGHSIRSATISPTGRYVVTNGHDGKAKIWILCSSAKKEPGAREAVRE